DYGVQLMTIHKSKGLEFEVVIVPDLQAQGGRGSIELLSWLERGLPEPGPEGELTEFLVAPLQYKGTDPGSAKRRVDHARRDRETQEMRRILMWLLLAPAMSCISSHNLLTRSKP